MPDPAVQHVLRGWNPDGGAAKHYLEVSDVLIRNVSTDIYREGFLMEEDGNSIFIFEVAGLCIGHLGHLHHKLTPQDIAEIGRIDVLFIPVDGTYTMSQEGMIELAGQLRSSMIVPMHWFSTFSLQRFVAGMEGKFETRLAQRKQRDRVAEDPARRAAGRGAAATLAHHRKLCGWPVAASYQRARTWRSSHRHFRDVAGRHGVASGRPAHRSSRRARRSRRHCRASRPWVHAQDAFPDRLGRMAHRAAA